MWRFLISVGSGALIGYITNYIAIVMLFHPYERKLWFRGVIPASVDKLAHNISLSTMQLLNESKGYIDKEAYLKELFEILFGNLGWLQKLFLSAGYYLAKDALWKAAKEGLQYSQDVAVYSIKVRIRDLDYKSLEKSVRGIIGTELRYIEIYGAILGGILGSITYLLH